MPLELSSLELDLIVRGLLALQQLQPEERAIQNLLNRLNSLIFTVSA